MSSSSTIRRFATAWAVSALVVAFAGCGTQSNPLASTDQTSDPLTSSETQVVTQAATSLSTDANTCVTNISVKITPRVLILASNGSWVTVHTDVLYSSVDTGTIRLNEIDNVRSFPDSCGNLVSQFRQRDIKEEIKTIVSTPEAILTLTLTGSYTDGDTFEGSDTIRVRRGRGR